MSKLNTRTEIVLAKQLKLTLNLGKHTLQWLGLDVASAIERRQNLVTTCSLYE